jgi:hypothetical protein
MIKDELEYQVSQESVEKFTKTLAAMERDEEAKRKDFLKWDTGRDRLLDGSLELIEVSLV